MATARSRRSEVTGLVVLASWETISSITWADRPSWGRYAELKRLLSRSVNSTRSGDSSSTTCVSVSWPKKRRSAPERSVTARGAPMPSVRSTCPSPGPGSRTLSPSRSTIVASTVVIGIAVAAAGISVKAAAHAAAAKVPCP